jgi:glycosyltransferase involved in cell wall biosynthesis
MLLKKLKQQPKNKIKIACLPVAGMENPYQYLMITGLNQNPKLNAFNGVNDRFLGILRTALKYKPDYIHFDWIASYYTRRYSWFTYLDIPLFFLQVFFSKYILKIQIIWTLHNLYPHTNYQRKLHIRVQRWFVKYVSAIRIFSVQSLPAAMDILNMPGNKFQIHSEGSYIDYYPNTVSKADAKTYLKIDHAKKVFLFFGSISPYKGILELIKEFNFENSLLICAGKVMDTNYFKLLQNAAGDRILFFNQFISVENVQYFFNAADVVVLPFKEIENSGSLILAMGFKKPIIAPATKVISERLHGQEELLFQPGGLYQKLQLAINLSNTDLESFGENNFTQAGKLNWIDFSDVFVNV